MQAHARPFYLGYAEEHKDWASVGESDYKTAERVRREGMPIAEALSHPMNAAPDGCLLFKHPRRNSRIEQMILNINPGDTISTPPV